jgi:2Fe-2S ferredoxin
MPVITFVESNGTRHNIKGNTGDTIMQVATFNDVPGIIAECNGAAACATCRVRVDEAWESKLSPPEPLELSLIVNGGQIPGHRGGVKVGHCDAGLTI